MLSHSLYTARFLHVQFLLFHPMKSPRKSQVIAFWMKFQAAQGHYTTCLEHISCRDIMTHYRKLTLVVHEPKFSNRHPSWKRCADTESTYEAEAIHEMCMGHEVMYGRRYQVMCPVMGCSNYTSATHYGECCVGELLPEELSILFTVTVLFCLLTDVQSSIVHSA